MGDVAAKLNQTLSDVETSMKNSERTMSEHVSQFRADVKTMLEDSLNPVNAYMNSMHVNASTMRMEVDELRTQVPQLQTLIKDVSEQLRQGEERFSEQSRQLGGRFEALANKTSSGVEKGERELGDLQTSLKQLRHDLADHLEKMHKSIAGNSEALETIRHSDLPKFSREFLTLEQKVAKWVRTEPMPGKINEARLYSLEARLAQEMDARLLFETQMDAQRTQMSSLSNAAQNESTQSFALPPLSRHTPRESGDGLTARSHAASKAKLSSRNARSLMCDGEQIVFDTRSSCSSGFSHLSIPHPRASV